MMEPVIIEPMEISETDEIKSVPDPVLQTARWPAIAKPGKKRKCIDPDVKLELAALKVKHGAEFVENILNPEIEMCRICS